jgi:two-component system, chemotaxis family, protein-glutamate methylesterase/glutaminase
MGVMSKDIVVVGASAGGIEALQKLVAALPKDYKGTIFVVIHTGATSPNILDKILERAGPLPATNAQSWEPIRPGHIYVAPADHHLLLDASGYLRTSRGPKENRFRPAIDVLFRSAAQAFDGRVIGVVLTGFLDDGTAGLWAVKACGGTAIVQHPEEAVAPSMPLNALKHVEVDHVVNLSKIGPLLVRLASTPASRKGTKVMSKEMETELKIAREDNALKSGIMEWGDPSVYACPECHGVLMQLKEGSNLRFRCHTGHAYSMETLMSDFSDKTEEMLWNAVRSIDEMVLLMRRMATHLDDSQHAQGAEALRIKADETQRRSEQVRQLVLQHKFLRTGEAEKHGPQAAFAKTSDGAELEVRG